MIWIDKSKMPVPTELIAPKSKGVTEREDVIKFYDDLNNKDKGFKYEAYRLKPVKESLEKLFHGKCAYCETKYIVSQPVDVEHYRPKGAIIINGKEEKPGYYWLASDWDNLLPSCIYCNRQNQQLLPDGTVKVLGKKNTFPVEKEAQRNRKHDEKKKEKPLLLNPCHDEPENHLVFTEEGFIRPAKNKSGRSSRKGRVSIEVYGLQRHGLVDERRERALLIRNQMQAVRNVLQALNQYPDDSFFETWLQREIDNLMYYIAEERKYAGMARQLIEPFLNSLKQR